MASNKTVSKEVGDNRLNKVISEVAKRAAPFKTVFAGIDGEAVLKELNSEFRGTSVVGTTAHETTIKAAQYDVLDYIEKMINFKGEL